MVLPHKMNMNLALKCEYSAKVIRNVYLVMIPCKSVAASIIDVNVIFRWDAV